MGRQFDIVFENSGAVVVADLLEDDAPWTCELFWKAIETPVHDVLHHGRATGPEMWVFVPPPEEEPAYENSTVFPEHGDILYYHYRQPPTREGVMVYDIGIYWDRGASMLGKQGWVAGNLFARVRGREQVELLRVEAGRLLMEGNGMVTLRRRS